MMVDQVCAEHDYLQNGGAVRAQGWQRFDAPGPFRVAIVGCGAISSNFHLPVLAGHDGVRVAALVDRDVQRASELARAYKVPTVLGGAEQLDPAVVDGAVVATPPGHHASCCLDLVNRGIHVFVEKPMAIKLADATAMVDAAQTAGVTLAAGYFRRLFPKCPLAQGHAGVGAMGGRWRLSPKKAANTPGSWRA